MITSETPARRGTVSEWSPDGFLVVANDAGEPITLNDTAAALWELCDGETTSREIVQAATHLFAGAASDIERDVLAALEALRQQGLIA